MKKLIVIVTTAISLISSSAFALKCNYPSATPEAKMDQWMLIAITEGIVPYKLNGDGKTVRILKGENFHYYSTADWPSRKATETCVKPEAKVANLTYEKIYTFEFNSNDGQTCTAKTRNFFHGVWGANQRKWSWYAQTDDVLEGPTCQ